MFSPLWFRHHSEANVDFGNYSLNWLMRTGQTSCAKYSKLGFNVAQWPVFVDFLKVSNGDSCRNEVQLNSRATGFVLGNSSPPITVRSSQQPATFRRSSQGSDLRKLWPRWSRSTSPLPSHPLERRSAGTLGGMLYLSRIFVAMPRQAKV